MLEGAYWYTDHRSDALSPQHSPFGHRSGGGVSGRDDRRIGWDAGGGEVGEKITKELRPVAEPAPRAVAKAEPVDQ
jgi:hypothetical protein